MPHSTAGQHTRIAGSDSGRLPAPTGAQAANTQHQLPAHSTQQSTVSVSYAPTLAHAQLLRPMHIKILRLPT
jgi:hypothetical protein